MQKSIRKYDNDDIEQFQFNIGSSLINHKRLINVKILHNLIAYFKTVHTRKTNEKII